MKSVRIERINSEIQKAISHIIDNDIRDPQIDAIISVSNVETTPDLSYCRVYITSIGTTPSDAGPHVRKGIHRDHPYRRYV